VGDDVDPFTEVHVGYSHLAPQPRYSGRAGSETKGSERKPSELDEKILSFKKEKESESEIFRASLEARTSPLDLSGKDFAHYQLDKIDLSNTRLQRSVFSFASITESIFDYSDLTQSNFSNSKLPDSSLSNTNLFLANFQASDLTRANLSNASIFATMFTDAKMRGANLSVQKSKNGTCDQFKEWGSIGSCFAGVDLVGANLRHRCFRNSNFELGDLSNADLTGAVFSGSNFKPKWRYKPFESTKLCRTILDDTEFWDVNFGKTDFSDVISARGASFGRVDFNEIILDNANLASSRITESSFCGLKYGLETTIFAQTAFIRCDFTEADLSRGNFEGAKFEDCIFSNTRMPDGTIPNS